jgi:hypothetical protein
LIQNSKPARLRRSKSSLPAAEAVVADVVVADAVEVADVVAADMVAKSNLLRSKSKCNVTPRIWRLSSRMMYLPTLHQVLWYSPS